MNLKGNILFPILLFGSITIAIASEMIGGAAIPAYTPSEVCAADTVIYPIENYKARRVGSFEDVTIADSLLGGPDTLLFEGTHRTRHHSGAGFPEGNRPIQI